MFRKQPLSNYRLSYTALTFLLCFWITVSAYGQRTIDLSGTCISGTVTVTEAGTEAGKPFFTGTGTVAGSANIIVTAYWIGEPNNVWVVAFSGQPFFSNDTGMDPGLPPDMGWANLQAGTCPGTDLMLSGDGVFSTCTPPDAASTSLMECETTLGGATADFDLTAAGAAVNNSGAVIFKFFEDMPMSMQITGGDITAFNASDGDQVYVKVEDDMDASCFSTATITLNVESKADPAFSYPGMVCINGADPVPSGIASGGGSFSVDNGASIDAATGELDLSTTSAGTTYEITYTISGDCPTSSTKMIMVKAADDAGFTYPATASIDGANPVPSNVNTMGGTFSINSGATIDVTTGELDLSAAIAGTTYTVTYTTAGDCPSVSTQMIEILAPIDPCTSDGIAPVVTAELMEIPSNIDKYRQLKVVCSVTDECDENPMESAVIGFPFPDAGLSGPFIPSFNVLFRTSDDRISLAFRFTDSETVDVAVTGPDPEAFWAQILADGGIVVENGYEFYIRDNGGSYPLPAPPGVEGEPNVRVRFRDDGSLLMVQSSFVPLACTGEDARGNSDSDLAIFPLSAPAVPAINVQPDANPIPTNEYQKLEEMENFDDFEPLSIEKEGQLIAKEFNLYPNPAKQEVVLSLENYLGTTVQVKITDAVGSVLYLREYLDLDAPRLEIDLENYRLAKGVYFVQLIENGRIATRQLILK